jgi:hypothetical protein
MELEQTLKIGLIQTTLNPDISWSDNLRITEDEEQRVWKEIKKGFRELKNHSSQPKIVILPELTIPRGYEDDVKKIAKKMGVIIIAGLDFIIDDDTKIAENKALIVIPQNWPKALTSRKTNTNFFGKTFFSYIETNCFEQNGLIGKPDTNMYILDAGCYGKIGIAICSDFYDIERFVIYKGKIHHMFVIAHNKDISSYYFLCEAISRLVYCNVVICNTGYYGGTVAYSPYKEPHQRIIYKHEGLKLFTTQVVELPVKALDNAQNSSPGTQKIFKSKPPGYDSSKIRA